MKLKDMEKLNNILIEPIKRLDYLAFKVEDCREDARFHAQILRLSGIQLEKSRKKLSLYLKNIGETL